MRKAHFPIAFASVILGAASLGSCQDEASNLGSSIFDGEVAIRVDSLAFDSIPSDIIQTGSIRRDTFDPRSGTTMLGSINTPEYGSLVCSYVARLLPAQSISLPDSIQQVDSAKVYIAVSRTSVVGDSLAPQQLKIYKLNKELPNTPPSNLNPDLYYDKNDKSQLLGTRNYTLSGLSLSDSAFVKLVNIPVTVPLDTVFANKWLRMYRNKQTAQIFDWPQTFAKEFPGIYVAPTFGRGCIGNVGFTRFFIYTHHTAKKNVIVDGVSTPTLYDVKDSTCLFTTAPEVLSSNIVHYTPSAKLNDMAAAGRCLVTTPGGYITKFNFPTNIVLDRYLKSDKHLGVINNLSLSVPAAQIPNANGLGIPPYLLMVKADKLDKFFEEGKAPDNVESFYATYNQYTGSYTFSGMRQYLIDLLDKRQKNSQIVDDSFVLVPVSLSTETINNSDGSKTTVVTGCLPYTLKPTMVSLEMKRASIVFTYSLQQFN